jgi:type IX secretion system PorP/SprF family membrane protein
MKKISSIICLFFSFSSFSQDIHFSQLQQTPQLISPALVGLDQSFQGIVNYRTQWNSIGDPFKTMASSVDCRINEENRGTNGLFGIGLQFFNDKSGSTAINTTNFNASIAYHLLLNSTSSLSFGINSGFSQRVIGNTDGRWSSQFDGQTFNSSLSNGEASILQKFTYIDLGTGLIYAFRQNRKGSNRKSNEFTIGLSAFHVNRPSFSFTGIEDQLGIRWSGFINGKIETNSNKITIQPALFYQQQEKYRQILLGANFSYLLSQNSQITGYKKGSSLMFGLFHRFKDAMILSTSLEIGNLSGGISYDFTVSNLSRINGLQGGFELFLKYKLNDKSLWKNRI